MQNTILLVDDESSIRASVQRSLHREPHRFIEAENGRDALTVISKQPVNLVLLDLRMPVMDGFGFLRAFRQSTQGRAIPVCVMTGEAADEDRELAVELGADDFICKPVTLVELKTRIHSLLRASQYQTQLARLNSELETRVEHRTLTLKRTVKELEQAQDEINLAYRETVLRLSLAAEMKDECTAGHLERMSQYSSLLAQRCGWNDSDVALLSEAAKMHDIGKIGIPDAILNKPGKLSEDEFRVMQSHTEIGSRILKGSKSKLLQMAAEVAISHHERFDGSGYPRGLSGTSIPEVGRIVAIADVFDALMSRRSYKEAWALDDAVKALKSEAGTHFDPGLVSLFIDEMDAVCEIHARFRDDRVEAK